jgi:transposase-like protein
VSLLVATGVNAQGYREILGIVEGAKEDKASWLAFLKHLKDWGLSGVRLIIGDGLPRVRRGRRGCLSRRDAHTHCIRTSGLQDWIGVFSFLFASNRRPLRR